MLPNFDPHPPRADKIVHFTYYLVSTLCHLTHVDFLLPLPPLLVHVVIECPLSCSDASLGGLCNTTLKGDSEYNELEFFLVGGIPTLSQVICETSLL